MYALLPPVGHEWVHIGDVLRLLFCVVLLWAAVREVAGRGRGAGRGARAAADRARPPRRGRAGARLHPAPRRADGRPTPRPSEIVVAAERALQDSRWAIEHLSRPPDEPLERVLARHAAVIAARTGVAVTFSTSGSADVGPEVSEVLARILGEAVANARHGNASRRARRADGRPAAAARDRRRHRVRHRARARPGFGLGGMRERAALVGAELSVRSGPGAGTEVAVELR